MSDDTRTARSLSPTATASVTATATAAVADDELERFRREWKDEVARKAPEKRETVAKPAKPAKPASQNGVEEKEVEKGKAKTQPQAIPTTDGDLATELSLVRLSSPQSPRSSKSLSPRSPKAALRSPTRAARPLSTSPTKIPFPQRAPLHAKSDAVKIYATAVEAEQSGRLNDALRLYRTAFKLDDNVDRLYQRQAAAEARAVEAEAEAEIEVTVQHVVDPSAPEEQEYTFRRHIQVHPDHERTVSRQSRLSALLSAAPETAAFAPEDEELPVPIATLPAELVEPILSHLDVGSIEAFASTCWRARALTAYSSVWGRIARNIYCAPMVPHKLPPTELARRHRGEWRTVLVEEERVRMDGCYIAVCHYVRPGAGEEWIAVTHMITYHRFLRFYPDGLVISFLTTDHPSDVVPNLNPSLRGKGLHFGRWRLVRSDEEEEEGENGREKDGATEPKGRPKDAKGKARKRARVQITDLIEPGAASPKYEFEMDMALRETNRGRWNKLEFSRYSTVNLATGEVLHLSLRHQKPFYFSKVRSWSPQL